MTESLPTAKHIFGQALEYESPIERNRFLDETCAANESLRAEVDDLLAANDRAGNFLCGPCGRESTILDYGVAHPIGTRIGPYKLREQIGEGGMGVVYVAEQTEPVKRKVALKIIKPGMASRDVVSRFEAERQTLAMMDHPNIARIIDAGATDSGQSFFIMELVYGVPLTEYCDHHELNMSERLELFVKVCRAVQHAHQKGVIHRDLKPTNVLVATVDGQAVPKVIDFGVAKAAGKKLTKQTVYTQFSQMVGTPLYMSPEQAELGVADVDTRSDVYSLGVLLYELLTGNTPFDGEVLKQASFDEMRRIIREDEPPCPSARVSTLAAQDLSTVAEQRGSDPRHLCKSFKGEVDWIVMKALEKDRNRRYESASALADDMNRYLRGEPILARPTSRWYRWRKFANRNRVFVASLIAVVAALSLGALLALTGLFIALQQRDIARRAGEDLRLQLEETKAANAETDQAFWLLWNLLAKRGTGSQPETYTVREAIDRLEAFLNDQLHDQPDVEYKFRQLLATNYHRSGDFQQARAHLDRALQLARSLYGDHSEEVADVYVGVANVLDNRETIGQLDFDEYGDFARRAIQIYEANGTRSWGASHAWFLWSLTFTKPEEREQRIKCLEKAMEIADESAANTDPGQLVYARTDLARVLREGDQADVERAKALYQEASRILEGMDDGKNFQTVRAHLLHTEACHYYVRDPDRTRQLFYSAWGIYLSNDALKRELLGHSYACRLAIFEFVTGRRKHAHEVISEVEDIAVEYDLSNSMAEYGLVRGWMHLVDQEDSNAIQKFEEALMNAERAGYSEARTTSAFCRFHLAEVLRRQGRIEAARKHYQEVERFTRPYLNMEDAAVEAVWIRAIALLYCDVQPNSDELVEAINLSDQALKRVPAWQKPPFFLAKAIAQQLLGDLDGAINSLEIGLNSWSGPYPSIHDGPRSIQTSTSELTEMLAKYK